MPLEPIGQMMEDARKGGYAIGYFESWNLESLQGTIDAAESARAPIIIGFNGEFLSHGGRRAEERLSWYAELGKEAAHSASVACGLIFNECANDEWTERAAIAGFNLVMPADPTAPLEDYTRRVKSMVELAHRCSACVEAEIGELPCGSGGKVKPGGSMTDPAVAAKFVVETKVDLLAVSVGNVHIRIQGEQGLDLNRLKEIHKKVSVPLVLHGGTGISLKSLSQAIRLGVTKVNYGTYLKQRYLAAIRTALKSDVANPHELLGMGGAADVMVAGRLAVRDAVLERIETLGCCGRSRP
jgi:ketose-bisphosphate aldolase